MKIKFLILFLFIFFNSFSQNMTFVDILSLKDKNKSEVIKFLNEYNWEIMHKHYSKEEKFGDIRFAFDNKSIDRQIPQYITFYHQNEKKENNRIQLQVLNKEKFDKYLTEFKSLDFEYITTIMDANQTKEIYKNNTTTIEVIIMPVNNYFGKQQTFYTFYIFDNSFNSMIKE
jgi:hypothetical protein